MSDRFAASSNNMTFHNGLYETEASTMGLPPGSFPTRIDIDDMPFLYQSTQRDTEYEIQSVTYRQHIGPMKLVVYND